ncbi:substrate-binding domain-containing protein [Arthrobacter rhombi]|uniref:substrate-binding domain-containing protein n=1 Tax=Arthrobacter rhombi TaxID=71253 RepID=UPI003FD37751
MAELRIAFVPGVTPDKWLDRWRARHPGIPVQATMHDAGDDPRELLASGVADLVFMRFPDGRNPADERTHVIPLYEELPVVCAPREHALELYDDEVPLDELVDETWLDMADYPPQVGGTAMALEVVGAGTGLLIVPQAVGRLYRRKDVVQKILTGAPSTRIGVAWLKPLGDDPEDPRVEEFIGIVRGRRANSSRQPSVQERERSAAEQAQRRRQRGGQSAAGTPRSGGGKKGGSSGGKPVGGKRRGGPARGRR